MKNVKFIFVLLMVIATMSCCKKETDPMETQIGDPYEGGYVFQTKTATQPGFICSTVILAEQSNWDNAVQTCSGYTIDGYSDWTLPSYDQLVTIKQKLVTKVDFMSHAYWSNTDKPNSPGFIMYYPDNNLALHPELGLKTALHSVLAVRKF